MKKLFVYGLAIVSMFSCKDDSSEISGKLEYQPSSNGSYWIYDYYEIAEDGSEKKLDRQDSIAVARDTTIDGLEYFVLEGETNQKGTISKNTFHIFRIENDRMYNEKGLLVLKNMYAEGEYDTSFKTEGEDTLYSLKLYSKALNMPIKVPAGDFECAVVEGEILPMISTGNIEYPRYTKYCYAKNKGLILERYFYLLNPSYFEKRLVRYHIEK